MNTNGLVRSFKDAFAGLYFCLTTQRNMVIHVIVGIIVITVAFFLEIHRLEKIILLATVFLVIILETVNTAVEKTVDVATREYSRDAYLAKVVSASAVLLSVFLAVLIGVVILGPPLLGMLLS